MKNYHDVSIISAKKKVPVFTAIPVGKRQVYALF